MATALYNNSYTRDDALTMLASAAKTADADGTTIDLGSNGFFEGVVVIDVTAIVINDNDELYNLQVQLSSDDFAAENIVKVQLPLGATEVVEDSTGDSVIGRYAIPVTNEWLGVGYRYIRVHYEISGTTPSITSSAFLTAR